MFCFVLFCIVLHISKRHIGERYVLLSRRRASNDEPHCKASAWVIFDDPPRIVVNAVPKRESVLPLFNF